MCPTRCPQKELPDKKAASSYHWTTSISNSVTQSDRDRIAYLSFMITKPSILAIFTPIFPILYHLNYSKTYGCLLVETCWHRKGWPFLTRWRNSVLLHRQAYENIIAQKWRRG